MRIKTAIAVSTIGLLWLAFSVATAKTICVNPAGSGGCYSKIQDALNAASENDSINVYPGQYLENVTINRRSIKLFGIGAPGSIKIIAYAADAVTLVSPFSNIKMTGFLIEAGSDGITCKSYSPGGTLQVTNCVIRNCGRNGIRFWGDSIYVRNCIIERNSNWGLLIDMACGAGDGYLVNNIIDSNRVGGVVWYTGCYLRCEYNDVWANTSNYSGVIQHASDINMDPHFVQNSFYALAGISPCIDAGSPSATYYDCDGTRNDMGIYGGPDAICGPGPVVTSLNLVPATVVKGEKFEIQATGAAR